MSLAALKHLKYMRIEDDELNHLRKKQVDGKGCVLRMSIRQDIHLVEAKGNLALGKLSLRLGGLKGWLGLK